jgi:hypothetical protein
MDRLNDGPVERHLDAVFDALAGTGSVGRRSLAEIEDHLQAAVAESLGRGQSLHDAEADAVERFGRPESIASGIVQANVELFDLIRPAFIGAWIVGALVLVAIGLSGVVAELVGRTAGEGFVSGDGPGVIYTADRCADFLEYFPNLSCADAATMHHFGEVVEYRVAAGVLGLLALLTLAVLRRITPLGAPAWTPPSGMVALVLAASFGVATALLGGTGVLALVGGSRQGVGADLSAGFVAGLACVVATAWALRVRSRPDVRSIV